MSNMKSNTKSGPTSYTLYHNPRCSKSRETLALLKDKGLNFEVLEYLNTPPTAAELESVAQKLGKQPLEFMRTGEARFKELGLSKNDQRSVTEWLQLMSENPILIERPILVGDQKAAIGRPPEAVLEIL